MGKPLSYGDVHGTGQDIHFAELFREHESKHAVDLQFPVESSDSVGGGIWGDTSEPF